MSKRSFDTLSILFYSILYYFPETVFGEKGMTRKQKKELKKVMNITRKVGRPVRVMQQTSDSFLGLVLCAYITQLNGIKDGMSVWLPLSLSIIESESYFQLFHRVIGHVISKNTKELTWVHHMNANSRQTLIMCSHKGLSYSKD